MGPTLFRGRAALLACLALFATVAPVLARPTKSDSKVKVTLEASKPDDSGTQVVTLNLDVEKAWHIYANSVGNGDLAEAATVVTFPKDKAETVKIEYPEGKLEKDATVGDYRIYEGQVTIKAHVRRAKGDSGPLEASIKVQACSSKGCLLPATIKVQVP
jgi:hypothetical protein